jgi:hypothetical protein
MGDDGFIRKFVFRSRGDEILKDIVDLKGDFASALTVGNTNIAKGKVVGKRVENGEHLVDLVMWIADLQDKPSNAAKVTVSLLTKENPLDWVKR